MIQADTTLSKGFQITLPSSIRKALGLQAGDPLHIVSNNGSITITKAETQEETVHRIFRELDELRIKREKNMTSEQKAFAEKTKGWTANQYREYIDSLPETKAYIKEKYGL